MELIIGNKNYSSWSLRPWFLLKAFDIPFSETRLALFQDNFYTKLAAYTPAGKVPVLIDGTTNIWDSLAICEYLNEAHLHNKAWPEDSAERAVARAIANEMHSGFFALRNEMPMNCRSIRTLEPSIQAQKEIKRIDTIWDELREKHAETGPWLFGKFSIADAMFAPIALRFITYQVESLSDNSQSYINTTQQHPAIKSWIAAAQEELEVIEEEEAGEPTQN